ncbi:MAG: hypothetical protein AAGA54_09225 [Myxococcota bacterium]
MLLAAAALALAAVTGAWWVMRTEPIPETLEAIEDDPSTLVIPGLPGQPPLNLGALEGKTVVFIGSGTWSAKSTEGEVINRALSRWVLPESTVGYVVADAAGLGLFRDDIESTMTSFASEIRFPLYVDYKSAFLDTFKLPKGHHALVVLGPDGAVLGRWSGGVEGETLAEVQAMLGATEPAPGPAMPAQLRVADLDAAACASTTCAFVFAGASVAMADIPGIRPGGFEGDDDAKLEQMRKPAVRVVTMARKMKLKTTRGAMVGDIDAGITSEGWDRVSAEDGAAARQALGLDADASAVVVFVNGAEVLRAEGLVLLRDWGRIADLLGIEGFNDRRPVRG